MNTRIAFLALALLPAAAFAQDSGEDFAVDPVCGMNVEKKTCDFVEWYQGANFYFCNQFCRDSFKEFPDKYSATVVPIRQETYRIRYFTRPSKIFSETPTEIFFCVEKASKDAVSKPKSMKSTNTVAAEVGGGKVQNFETKVEWKAKKEEGWFGMQTQFSYPGHLSIRVTVTFEDGVSDEQIVKLPILPGEKFDTGKENAGKRVDMTIQHETMRKIGKYWTKIGEELRHGTKEGVEAAKPSMALIKGYQVTIKDMFPHVFAETDMDEFRAVGADLEKELQAFEGVLNGGDPKAARESWERVDARNCTECHMKFRWSVFSDLNHYPVRNGDK